MNSEKIMKNEFGKNYEYIDDYIQSCLNNGQALLYQMLVDMKKALIEKDETIKEIKSQNRQHIRYKLKLEKIIQDKDIQIKLLKNKMTKSGVKYY
jgi:hypothetical protein